MNFVSLQSRDKYIGCSQNTTVILKSINNDGGYVAVRQTESLSR